MKRRLTLQSKIDDAAIPVRVMILVPSLSSADCTMEIGTPGDAKFPATYPKTVLIVSKVRT